MAGLFPAEPPRYEAFRALVDVDALRPVIKPAPAGMRSPVVFFECLGLFSLLGNLGVDDPERCADAEEVVKEEPFPLKEWDCVSFPMTGFIVRGKNRKPYNRLPPEKDLSKFCAERRLWFGIELEFPDPSPKHAEAYAPDGSVMFKEDYDGEPPSFYAAVEEYYPVYEIRRVARGED